MCSDFKPKNGFIPNLAKYLAERYDSAGIRRLVMEHVGFYASMKLPGKVVSLHQLAYETSELLVREGAVGSAFFQYLEEARPDRSVRVEIARLRTLWDQVQRDCAPIDRYAWTPNARWLQWGAVIFVLAVMSYGLHQSRGFSEVLGIVGDDKYAGAVFGATLLGFFGLVPWLHAVRHGISLSLRSPTLRPHLLQLWLPGDWRGFQKPLNAVLVAALVLGPASANVAAVQKFLGGTACEMESPRVEKTRPRRSFSGWRGHLLGFPDSDLSEVCRDQLPSNREYTYGASAQSYWRFVEPWFFTMLLVHNVVLTLWILFSLIILRRRPNSSTTQSRSRPADTDYL